MKIQLDTWEVWNWDCVDVHEGGERERAKGKIQERFNKGISI
jgi:hypothetical protein